jgi:hypothetical protein
MIFTESYDIQFIIWYNSTCASFELQVAIFVVLAMVLRRKPDVMISLLPIMKESQKYQGQDKLPVTVWMIAQVTIFNLS